MVYKIQYKVMKTPKLQQSLV